MRVYEALQRSLVERQISVVSEYDLFRLLARLLELGQYQGRKLRGAGWPDRDRYRNIVGQLLAERYLRPDPDFYPQDEWRSQGSHGYSHARVFRVSDVPDVPAEDVAGLVDPFCYISHLSAMQRYSLTNRIPVALNLSTPRDWGAARQLKLIEDYGDVSPERYKAPLAQLSFPEKLRGRTIALHKTVRTPKLKAVRGSAARIAAIGETFMQMLDRGELCGGMAHVIDVWDQHASTYFEEIVAAVDDANEAIIKVRAGYLLEERLGLSDPRISAWEAYAQRGGSRKLDASAAYEPRYSEKWKISLNAGSRERPS